MTPDEAAAALRAEGWALLPPSHSQDDLRCFTERLDALREAHGVTALHRPEPAWVAETVEVAGPGLAFYQLLGLAPELAPRLFTDAVLAAASAALGEAMHLELVGAVMSDEARSFTEWETHLGGIDDERWRREGKRPRKPRIERLVAFLFLEPMTDETGPWRVIPRRVGDPVEPRGPLRQPDWPGAVTLSSPAGAVLLLDESTWHSVTPRRTPGVRRFVGAYFARDDVAPTVGVDATLDAFADVLPVRPR
ncbi:MAG: hypothetical protein R3B82_03090 [Sandaracinaceae bacterium]